MSEEHSRSADEMLEAFTHGLECAKGLLAENERLRRRSLEIEEENNAFANLYVASHQLHSTLDLAEVVRIVVEIAINLIGAETVAVYGLDEKSGRLEPIACEGGADAAFPSQRLGAGTIGRSVASGETWVGDPQRSGDAERPVVCIPLRVQDRPIGAIVILRLLAQKRGFTALDRELFQLLAGHAASAMSSARLHSQSERKLHTIQGFIDLLTR